MRRRRNLDPYFVEWENFGPKHTQMLQISLKMILPEVLISIIYEYDLNFQIKFKSYFSSITPALIIYCDQVFLLFKRSVCCIFTDEHLNIQFLWTKHPQNSIWHDGWKPQKKNSHLFEKLKCFDPYHDHIIEESNDWIINNTKISRPIGGEVLICKRNFKLYTGNKNLFCYGEIDETKIKMNWHFQSLPFDLPHWTQWSIFLDNIFIMIEEKSRKKTLDKMKYNLVLYNFFPEKISHILTIPLYETMNNKWELINNCYLLSFKNTIHIILEKKKNFLYFNITFGHEKNKKMGK